jgi:transposase
VLRHCGTKHCNFDNRILTRANWLFSGECVDVLNYLRRQQLVCPECDKAFTTEKTFLDHEKSDCKRFSHETEKEVVACHKSTQTMTEYILLEEELVVLRREYLKLSQGIVPDLFIDVESGRS